MIHIGGDWYVDADPLNITLYRRGIAKQGKSQGEETYTTEGYYGTFQQLLDGLARREVRLTISESEALMEVNRGIAGIHRMIADFCKQYGKEIEKKLREESGDEGTKGEGRPVGE